MTEHATTRQQPAGTSQLKQTELEFLAFSSRIGVVLRSHFANRALRVMGHNTRAIDMDEAFALKRNAS